MTSNLLLTSVEPEALEAWDGVSQFWEIEEGNFCGAAGAPTTLVLRVGAKVVLLSNLNPEGGLVNGTQGEVVKFVDIENWPVKEPGEGERRGGL